MADRVVAVDVGTASARAGVFAADGALLGHAARPIRLDKPRPGWGEQASEDIWRAVCAAVRAAMAQAGAGAGARPEDVRGIGFDATCSLTLRDRAGAPLALGADGADTLCWFDHRATAEACACTATGHAALADLGGAMSPEMQTPKLMWLKRRRPDLWARLGHAFDLADFLTWRATGVAVRGHCAMVSKWGWRADQGWPLDFLRAAGLEDVIARAGLPNAATPVGAAVGALTAGAAAELGLAPGACVASGMIDAHAGALGALAAAPPDHAALIAGTSTCLMTLAPAPLRIPGAWGPHNGAVSPGMWAVESGQSASGALLDHLIETHAAGGAPTAATHARIAARIADMRARDGGDLAPRLHVLPDFNGARGPAPDPRALGALSGLTLDASFDGLCRIYWRACVALALGVRQIADALAAGGAPVAALRVIGGHTRNPVLMRLYADAAGRPVIAPQEGAPDGMLLGGAVAAATAAGLYPDLRAAAAAMAREGRVLPADPGAVAWLARDMRALKLMQAHRRALDALG